MKVTGKMSLPATFTGRNPADADLKPARKWTTRNTRWKRVGAPVVGRGSRPETPLLKWKTEEWERGKSGAEKEDGGRRRKGASTVSARKLAAGLWRLQLPETVTSGGGDQLVSKVEPLIQFSNFAMEGATKWDPVCFDIKDEVRRIYGRMRGINRQVSAVSVVSPLEAELEKARVRIEELETKCRSSKKKLEHFSRKVSEEKAAWKSREHEKMQAFVDSVKADLNREKKNRKRLEFVHSKLANELAAAKFSAMQHIQDYEKERKDRDLVEEICDELAKEIGKDRAEVEALKRDSMKIRDEVEEERKMLQMAEVWREERVQMKLIDAKVALEEKYSQMNKLVADLDTFLRSRPGTLDVKEIREAGSFRQAAASVNVQEINEFIYEPSNPDDSLAVFEDVALAEANGRETEPCISLGLASKVHMVSSETNMTKKTSSLRHSNVYVDEIEEDESGWETVSHLEDQGSSCSPEGSAASANKYHRDSDFSGSGTEWEWNACGDTPITKVCSLPARSTKKVSSITRLWRSVPNNEENYKIISVKGTNTRLSHGRKSNGAIMSPDQGSSKGEFSPSDLVGHWSSPDSGHPHITKGCIEWPRGIQKKSLKAKLLKARMESQKVQLQQVLEQKI